MARRRSQQTGYVHRQGDAWYLAYREDAIGEDGHLVRVRRNKKIANAKEMTKRQAQRIARQVLAETDAQALCPASLITLEEFVEGRFNREVVWAKKAAGKQHYNYILSKHLVPALGDYRLRDVTFDLIQNLVREKIESGYSVQTARHIRNVVSRVFNHAKRVRAYIGDNPAQGVILPESDARRSWALTFEQGMSVLEQLPTPAREMVLVSMTCTLNVAELLGLRWKWLNLSDQPVLIDTEMLPGRTLGVRENYYRGTFGSVKAKARRRNVPLGQTLVTALSNVREQSAFTSPEDLVFCTDTGTPLDEQNMRHRYLDKIAKKLGLPPMGWHVFRHSAATFSEAVGMALSDRQAQMGHGDVRMTMHYTHSDLNRRRESVDAIADKLLGKTPKSGDSDTR